MNVLFGTYAADAGTIEVEGRPVAIRSSADALNFGIGMVHQHFELVPRHTVLENLLVGTAGPDGRLSRRTAIERLAAIGRDYHLDLDPDRLVGDLSVGEQQRVEIAKSLVRGARILVLDEPTATLTPREADGLFRALRAMAARGMGVIFISHKLGEVLEITSRITIMRHGRWWRSGENDGSLSKPELARLMCGRDLVPPAEAGRRRRARRSSCSTAFPQRRGPRAASGRLADAARRRDRRHRRRLGQRPARARRPRRRRARSPTRARVAVAGEIVAEPSPKAHAGAARSAACRRTG